MNENVLYTTHAVCRAFHIREAGVDELVFWGVANPKKNKSGKWLFTQNDFENIDQVIQFRKNLCINTPGAALVLKLVEEVKKLRTKEY